MDDLIRRQEAIEYYQRISEATNTDSRYNLGFVDGLEFCINHLSTMPSAQPERKKGIWIKAFKIPLDTKHNDISFDRFMCSNCTAQTNRMTDFCPNCGADMREEKDNG